MKRYFILLLAVAMTLAAVVLIPMDKRIVAANTANAAAAEDWLLEHFSETASDGSADALETEDELNKPIFHFGVWNFIFFCVLTAIGLFLLIKPELIWKIEHWLSVEGGEPSDFYIFGARAGGILMLIGGLAMFLLDLS